MSVSVSSRSRAHPCVLVQLVIELVRVRSHDQLRLQCLPEQRYRPSLTYPRRMYKTVKSIINYLLAICIECAVVSRTRRRRSRRDRDVHLPGPRRNRDVDSFSREETETRRWYVSRPRRRDRDHNSVTRLRPRVILHQCRPVPPARPGLPRGPAPPGGPLSPIAPRGPAGPR